MVGFKEYKETIEIQDKIALLMYIVENNAIINESYDMDSLTETEEILIVESINSELSKMGIKLHKGTGIISYLKQFTSGASKIIIAAIKGDKEEVKKIASSLTKAKFIDFLIKLDMVTFGLLSTPLDFIQGITGWDLESDFKYMAQDAKEVISTVKKAFDTIKSNITYLFGDNKDGLSAVNKLEVALIPTN